MVHKDLILNLLPSQDDAKLESREYQSELALFYNKMLKDLEGTPVYFAMDSVGGGGGWLGELHIHIEIAIISVDIIKDILSSWIKGRSGRSFSLKNGDYEVEGNIEDIDALISHAKQLKSAGETEDN